MTITNEETKDGIKLWSSLYKKNISQQDYNEICQNLDGFFSILKEWGDKDKEKK